MESSSATQPHTRRRNRVLRFFVVLMLSCLFSLLVVFLQGSGTPAFCARQILQDPVSLCADAELSSSGYEVSGRSYTQKEGEVDPQLVFTGIGTSFTSVELIFDAPLFEGEVLQVFWPDASGQFSADRSILLPTDSTSTDYFADLPETATGTLRIDINGDFVLANVLVSAYPSAMTVEESAPFPWGLFAFLLPVNFLLFALAGRYGRTWKRAAGTFFREIRDSFGSSAEGGTVSSASSITPARRRALRQLCLPILAAVLLPLLVGLPAAAAGRTLYAPERRFLVAGGILLFVFLLCIRPAGRHPEAGFALAALSAGILLLLLAPASTYVTWDDEIHYRYALTLSYGGVPHFTCADLSLIRRLYRPDYISAGAGAAHEALLNRLYREGVVQVIQDPSVFRPSNAGYIPAALGLVAGRALHLPFAALFRMGRAFSLAFYILLGVLSIRALKYGKMLAALILLLPINLFQACSYTTDSWCFVWILYGLCRYLGFLQDRQAVLSPGRTLGTALCIVLGCLPKPVYAPVLLVFFVIPKDRFKSRAHRARYYGVLLVLAAACIPAVGKYWPQLLSHLTDARGGEDVDALRQAAGILSDPGRYFSMSLGYMFRDYLSPMRESSYLTNTGYFPIDPSVENYVADFPGTTIWLFLLVFAAISGGSPEEEQSVPAGTFAAGKIAVAAGSLLSVYLTITAMYLFYTPVGYGTVLGCQGRYLEPVMLGILWLLRSRKVQHRFNPEHYNAVLLLAALALFFWGAGHTAFMAVLP